MGTLQTRHLAERIQHSMDNASPQVATAAEHANSLLNQLVRPGVRRQRHDARASELIDSPYQ